MLIITVARKPLDASVGTVASNSMKWGTGGINIDASRIGAGEVLPGGGGKLWSHYRDGTEERAKPQTNAGQGRWPTNLILSHMHDCRCLGHVQAKGNRTGTRPEGDGGREDRTQGRFRPTEQTKRGYSDEEGQETVASWECAEGCPVAIFPIVSTHPGTLRSDADKGRHIPLAPIRKNGTNLSDGNVGLASRFFKQVQGLE